ncbi:hypothetical protein Tco_0906713 [Tanacetum coccineum]|uniref:MAK10-like protein n=1 Tax=Tanacetum coccineum TaxID=301880 RepID=A0ABQ5CI77_9ASTR
MGDENQPHTLGDYSPRSHEGYQNTIELLEGENLVPLQSNTIRLVQNGYAFHGLQSEDPDQHLKDFLKPVDSLDLSVENYAARGRLRKMSTKEAWNTIEELVQYEDEEWDDLFSSDKGNLDYGNANREQIL